MKKNNWIFEYTLDFVKKKRSLVSPNDGFRKQLIKFEKKLNLNLKMKEKETV